jgi:hypothetical protein
MKEMQSKINRIITSFTLTLVFISIIPATTTFAATCKGGTFIFPRWYDGLCTSDGTTIESPNAINATTTDTSTGASATEANATATNIGGWLTIIALNIVQMLLYAVGYVSIGYIIFGGFKYMTQGDNSSGTVAARKTIQNAIIGLVLSIMSVAIIKFVTEHIV